MPNNGVAVALAPELASTPAVLAKAGKPGAAKTEIERQIGDVLETLAAVSVLAWHEVRENGRLDPTTKMEGGNLVASLYEWQKTLGETDFVATVRHQGRLRLQHNGVALSAAIADDVTKLLLQVVKRVTITMQAMNESTVFALTFFVALMADGRAGPRIVW